MTDHFVDLIGCSASNFAGSANTALYNRKFVEDLLCIRESFNRFIVRAYNDLVKKLKFPDIHLKREI